MAAPAEGPRLSPPGPRDGYEGPLGAVGWALEWLDFGVYSVERIIVVTSLIAMTVIEFVYILSLYVTEQLIAFRRMADPGLRADFPVGLAVLVLFVGLMSTAVVNNTPLGRKSDGDKRSFGLRIMAVVTLLLAIGLACSLTVLFEDSSSTYLVLVTLIMVPATAFFYVNKAHKTFWLMVGLTILAYLAAATVPTGYSWADKRALFLLLWVGFIGASMAAKERRHIRIDAVRKLVPAKLLPRFDGLSTLVAGLFSGLLVVVGGIYLFHGDYGRFWVSTIPGEIPDWIKVASIPLAFLIITLRFVARGVRLLVWGEPSTERPAQATAEDVSP